MLMMILSYAFLSGVVAVFVSALGEAELGHLRAAVLKRWATYLVIGVIVLIWLSIAQEPLLLP